MEQTHTPGPWHWIADLELGRSELWPVDASDSDAPIAMFEGSDLIGIDQSPDLRLVAAAPDLLAALEWVLSENGIDGFRLPEGIRRRLADAVRKATGDA